MKGTETRERERKGEEKETREREKQKKKNRERETEEKKQRERQKERKRTNRWSEPARRAHMDASLPVSRVVTVFLSQTATGSCCFSLAWCPFVAFRVVAASSASYVVGIAKLVRGDNGRTNGGKRVKRLANKPLAAVLLELPVARRDIVRHGVACDVLHRIRFLPKKPETKAIVFVRCDGRARLVQGIEEAGIARQKNDKRDRAGSAQRDRHLYTGNMSR